MLKFVFNLVSVDNKLSTPENDLVNDLFTLNHKEYLHFLNQKRKLKCRVNGIYQFVPADVWAMCWFNAANENSLSKEYTDTYVVNLYCLYTNGKKIKVDFKAFYQSLNAAIKKIKETFSEEMYFELLYTSLEVASHNLLLDMKCALNRSFEVGSVEYLPQYSEEPASNDIKGVRLRCAPKANNSQ